MWEAILWWVWGSAHCCCCPPCHLCPCLPHRPLRSLCLLEVGKAATNASPTPTPTPHPGSTSCAPTALTCCSSGRIPSRYVLLPALPPCQAPHLARPGDAGWVLAMRATLAGGRWAHEGAWPGPAASSSPLSCRWLEGRCTPLACASPRARLWGRRRS